MIKYAIKEDIPLIVNLSREFYFETGSDKYYGWDKKTIELVLLFSISNNFVLTDGKYGFFLFNVYPSFYDINELILAEVWWYVQKDIPEMKRGRIAYQLLKAVDKEAVLRGVKHISINNLVRYNFDKVGNFYEKLGYDHRENNYMKEVI